jgi:hypothetical protein
VPCNQLIFKRGIKNAQKALASGKLTDKEANDLAEVLEYLGTAGDGNDVRIAFGKVEGAWGELAGENHIKIDMKGIIAESKKDHFGYKFDLTAEVGSLGVHEGRHGKNRDHLFRMPPGSLDQSLAGYGAMERKAYESGSFVFKGLGASSSHGFWRANWDREGLSAVDKETLRNIGVNRAVDHTSELKKQEILKGGN